LGFFLHIRTIKIAKKIRKANYFCALNERIEKRKKMLLDFFDVVG